MKNEARMSWDDIIFDDRNKEYGAFVIRQSYARNTIKGALIALLIATLVLAFPAIVKFLQGDPDEEKVELKTIKYTDLAAPPPIDKNIPPPPKLDVPPPVKTVIKFLPPKVTEKEVVEKEEVPTIEEIKKNETGAETSVGEEVVFNEPVEEVAKGDGVDENAVFNVVEQMPEFNGGVEAMMKFIGKNLRYPPAARRMGIEGKVFIGFVVDAEGKITDVQVVRGISADCDQEGARVIKSMPHWKPGKQRGRPVRVRFTLPINFTLAN